MRAYATYVAKCVVGESSIWSMKFFNADTDHVVHKLTIEVQHQSIVQARGKLNRIPNVEEVEWLQCWGIQAEIHVPRSLLECLDG